MSKDTNFPALQYPFKVFIVITCLFFSFLEFVNAQEIEIGGKILDTSNNTLVNANIIGFPEDKRLKTVFAISDNDGNYRLKILKQEYYDIEISHLGFEILKKRLKLEKDSVINFSLKEESEILQEVLIKRRLPVKISEDTTTYRVENFLTGEERKLRDVLSKLPGIDVDNEGNVKVNGKDVTKLMVEGRKFFTGDEKLGVNNIPADAVDEIEAIDNYNEINFLKNLEDSEKLALNIKLKDGKKKFIFGDINLGTGLKSKYIFNPALFYYSPNTAINNISDFNNFGKKSFSLKDYLNFEGGISSFSESPSSYFQLISDDFSQFLIDDDFLNQKNDFEAFSFSQRLDKKSEIEAYTIFSKSKSDFLNISNNRYLINEELNEIRTNKKISNLFFTLSKFKYSFSSKSNKDLSLELYLKTNSSDNISSTTSVSDDFENKISLVSGIKEFDLTSKLNYSFKISDSHTSSVNLFYKNTSFYSDKNWGLTEPIFTSVFPLVQEDSINLNQKNDSYLENAGIRIKHYWVLNRTNHIYPEIGITIENQSFNSDDIQILNNGEVNNFKDFGFSNKVNLGLISNYVGLNYKMMVGNFLIKPALFYQYYLWDVEQFDERIVGRDKSFLLPEFLFEWKINSRENLKAKYLKKSRFPNVSQFSNRLRLSNFNTLLRGNEFLENELYHQSSIFYSNFNLYKGLFISGGLSYTKRDFSIRSSTRNEGINLINEYVYTNLPENNFGLNGSISKKTRAYRFTLGGGLNLFEYSRIINDEILEFETIIPSYNLKVESFYDYWPNFQVGLKQNFSFFRNNNSQNNFSNFKPFVFVEYDFLNDFFFNLDYTYTSYMNKTLNQNNVFQELNLELLYDKKSSPWTLGIEVMNLFDVDFRNNNFFNQFIVSDNTTFIQPRVILFKLSYKL